MSKRKSGLRDPFAEIEELDFSVFTAPYSAFEQEYRENVGVVRKIKYGTPFLVTYVDEPDLFFISFQKNKDRAKGAATKYYKENLHPNFINRGWRNKYNKCRAIVVHEFNEYARTGRVPISKLMDVLDIKVSCSGCGSYNFSYEDIKNKRCFAVEGEGGINVFTDGYILCYDCYKKLFGESPL